VAILYGDGVARALGATPDNTKIDFIQKTDSSKWTPDAKVWRVLSLKALEIGATVTSKANFFGVKVYYGGGAAATYMVFDLGGEVYCSANVFDYGGRIKAKNFNHRFRLPDIDPASQLLYIRGRCSASIADP
jgi:hypothetical protein